MRKITLNSMRCHDTEDWGEDELRLDIAADGTGQGSLRRDMDEGETWNIRRSYTFDRNVTLRLFDEDRGPDDHLGTATIGGTPRRGTARFNRDGADYVLRYTVEDVPDTKSAHDLLDDFRRSTARGVWPRLSKQQVLADMQSNLANPYEVRQTATPMCGQAAIVFELVRRSPERYVALCRELFEEGCMTLDGGTVRASSRLKNSGAASRYQQADWMLMAAMREDDNEIFDVSRERGQFVNGVTTPWEMKNWTRLLLGCGQTSYTSTLVWGELDALREANRAIRQGGVAFLMVHGDIVHSKRPALDIPTHWIAFLGNLSIQERWGWDNGQVRFDAFSWFPATTRSQDAAHVSPANSNAWRIDMNEGAFEDGMFGLVTGV